MTVSELIDLLRDLPPDAVVMSLQDGESEPYAQVVRRAFPATSRWTYEHGESKGRPYEAWYPGGPHSSLRYDCEHLVYESVLVVLLTCSHAMPIAPSLPSSVWSIAMQRIDALYDIPQFVASTLVRKIAANSFQLPTAERGRFASIPADVLDNIERIVLAAYVKKAWTFPHRHERHLSGRQLWQRFSSSKSMLSCSSVARQLKSSATVSK